MRNYGSSPMSHWACVSFALALLGAVVISVWSQEAGQASTPMENLPGNIRQLTWFGERPVWSPNGKRLAFMSKSFGDAMEYELESGHIRCLTCSFPHAGFLRVHYLANSDYLLIGPAEFKNPDISRNEEAELWVLRADLATPPIRLGQRLWEGVAVSHRRLRIAWSNNARQYPERISPRVSELYIADLEYSNGEIHLVQRRKVHDNRGTACWLEAQDFRRDDHELIYTCYRSLKQAYVMGIDLETEAVTDYSQSPDDFQEPEGIFPDEKYIAVESDRHNDRGVPGIDIWKLRLDGTGRNMKRLTFFSEYPGWRADNPTISPDGHTMAFQPSRSDDTPGVGRGIFLFRLLPESPLSSQRDENKPSKH